MDEPSPASEGAEAPHSSEASASAEALWHLGRGQCILDAGGRWRGYEIEGPMPEAGVHVYAATDVSRMEPVLISASPLDKETAGRREVWAILSTRLPTASGVLACIEAIEENGWRYEVMSRPPAMALREWISCHQADGWTQKHLLEQLVGAVTALHAQGLVHLNLRPETVYVDGQGARMKIVLGAIDTAMLYNHPRLATVKIDPFYAPPEAVAPGAAPGIALRAWDWWSVGRVMQELVLGRHVMSALFKGDVIREPTPELRAQAEALLHEQAPPGVRAGAVEAMGVTDPATKTMLEGLLTTAREARWEGDAVRRWLANEPVVAHYELERDARFFNWKGRGLTVPEAVAFFRTEENWADGNVNMSEPDNPATLAHFLSTVPGQEQAWRKLQGIYERMEAPEWGSVPQSARRCLTTAAAWAVLGSPPAPLMVWGRRVDAEGLDDLLSRSEEFHHCSLVKALMSAPGLALVRSLDPAAAQVLAQLAAVGHEALLRAEERRWIDPEDLDSQAGVLRLALAAEPAIRAKADRIRAAYATCSDPELAALLVDPQPAAWANVLLVTTGADPHRFGYITKAEYGRRHRAETEERGRQLRAAVFWRRLWHLLRAGRPATDGWNSFMLFLGAVAVLGLGVAQDAVASLGLLAGLLVLRWLLAWRVRRQAGRLDPAATPWNWRDGSGRCLADLQRVCPADPKATLAGLERQLAETEAVLAALGPEGKDSRPEAPPLLGELWAGLAVGVILCVVAAGSWAKSYRARPTTAVEAIAATRPASAAVSRATAAPAEPAPDPLLGIPGITPEMVAKLRRGEYEIVRGGFGDTLHGPIRAWDFPPPAVIPALRVSGRMPATPGQRAFARVSAALLLDCYGQKKINALLVVQVPTGAGTGLMLYNARDRQLIDGDTLLLQAPPVAGSWYRLDRRKVVYLGVPASLEDENSLALK